MAIDTKKYFQVLIITFLAIQVISWILHVLLGYPLLKLGWVFILTAGIILIVTLYTFGTSLDRIDTKTIIFMILVFAGVIFLAIVLPIYVPEIFSTSGLEYANQLNSIIGIGG